MAATEVKYVRENIMLNNVCVLPSKLFNLHLISNEVKYTEDADYQNYWTPNLKSTLYIYIYIYI